jgi:hypothetical protein
MTASSFTDPLARNAEFVEGPTMLAKGAHIPRRISWAAIFGGVMLVVAIQLLLSMLGAGICSACWAQASGWELSTSIPAPRRTPVA